MTSRIRLLITAAVLCHLLLAPRLVTSQLLPAPSPQQVAISTIMPGAPIQLFEGGEDAPA